MKSCCKWPLVKLLTTSASSSTRTAQKLNELAVAVCKPVLQGPCQASFLGNEAGRTDIGMVAPFGWWSGASCGEDSSSIHSLRTTLLIEYERIHYILPVT